ncbi:hypothetical protein Emed_005502 [Eimeria media]
MQPQEPASKGGSREGPSQWSVAGSPDPSQQPEVSGLVQSLRLYVARANAENRSMAESPLSPEFFRFPTDSRTAAAAAAAADKEDRLLQLVRGYGCAVILANFITTFIFSIALMFVVGANAPINPDTFPKSFALTPYIEVVPASPTRKLEEALGNPRSVIITTPYLIEFLAKQQLHLPPSHVHNESLGVSAASHSPLLRAFDSNGFSVIYRHDIVGWEVSRSRSSATLFLSANRRLIVTSSTILFQEASTGLALAEWDLWENETDSSPHKVLREALHAGAEEGGDPLVFASTSPAATGATPATGAGDVLSFSPFSEASSPSAVFSSRRLAGGGSVLLPGAALDPFAAAASAAPTMLPHEDKELARLLRAMPLNGW